MADQKGFLHWRTFVDRHRIAIAYAILVLGSLSFVRAFNARVQGDVGLYQAIAADLAGGKLPYRDRVVEYPPYAVPLFALPRVFGNENYADAFIALAFSADLLIKILLFISTVRHPSPLRSLGPLLLYSIAVPFLGYFYLQRYDVWPALISLLAVTWFCRGRHGLAGAALAVGIGIKLYPAVFGPPLFFLAVRQKRWRPFVLGLAVGLLPLLLSSLLVPWWRFAAFQSARGLQVESLYASVLWLGKLLGAFPLAWEHMSKWYEVRGAAADSLLPWARGLFAASVVASTALVATAAARLENISAPRLSRLLLVPLLAFIAFNPVLSPQFLIWILPLAALGSAEGRTWPALAVVAATALTPVIFPSLTGNYFHGLNLLETVVLVARNLILIAAWAAFAVEWIPLSVSAPVLRRLSAPRVRQFLKFCLVGASGVAVDMAVLHLLSVSCGWSVTVSKLVSAETAMLNNFLWNELWTFGGRQPGIARRLWRFHLICGAGIAMAVLLVKLFYENGLNLYAANLIAIAVVTFWNFFMNAMFNWRIRKTELS
jgi:putative flippase GtrA